MMRWLRAWWDSLALPGTAAARRLEAEEDARFKVAEARHEASYEVRRRRAELTEHDIDVKPVSGNPGYVVVLLDPENTDTVLFNWIPGQYLTKDEAWDAAWTEYSLRKQAMVDGA